ncbi:hypothetical protein [Symmachiella dynata]|uniref:hypothetical protein n=1 Tax=Symmachiella dynata TaxID=2527995 RepID=UPI0018D355E9|nr:hypothetical protein [Symmachiella dynata]
MSRFPSNEIWETSNLPHGSVYGNLIDFTVISIAGGENSFICWLVRSGWLSMMPKY